MMVVAAMEEMAVVATEVVRTYRVYLAESADTKMVLDVNRKRKKEVCNVL
jgi:hypothetical protein